MVVGVAGALQDPQPCSARPGAWQPSAGAPYARHPLPEEGLFVEVPGSRRIAFFLPYEGELLVGTTEQAQQLNEPARASPQEQEELLGLVAYYLPAWLAHAQQHGRRFVGLRPIVRSRADVSSASREADLHRNGRLLTVFGGKWTTARALAERLADVAPFNGQP